MYQYETYSILPANYEGELSSQDVTITISVSTTEDDYRCRDIDDSRTSITVDDFDGDRIYSQISSRDHWDEYVNREIYGRGISISDLVPESVGEEISNLFSISCSSGKYPDVGCSLNYEYYEEVAYSQDTDRNRGLLTAVYYVRIHLHEDDAEKL